jgi:hypothetical protein
MLTPDLCKTPRSLQGWLDPLIFVGWRAFGVVDDILSAHRLTLPRSFVTGKQSGVKLLLTTVAASAAGLIYVMPAQADDVAIRIMTQNVYQGTNFDELFAAKRSLNSWQPSQRPITTFWRRIRLGERPRSLMKLRGNSRTL